MRINVNTAARKIEVDNRIPLRNYYRIADNLLRQASVHREEKNVIDLYIILLRFSSLVSETIPFHRDYQALHPKERASYKKRLLPVLDELESLKPEFQNQLEELNEEYLRAHLHEVDGPERGTFGLEAYSLEWPSVGRNSYSTVNPKRFTSVVPQSSLTYDHAQVYPPSSLQIDKQFNKSSIILPRPKQETLSRHSFLGPAGLRGQWLGPSSEIKVQYPSSTDLVPAENLNLNQAGQYDIVAVKDGHSEGAVSSMESVLSLDDGRWSRPAEELCPQPTRDEREDTFQFVGLRQPSPPPILAQVQQEFTPIPPSKVADPRPGPAKPSEDGLPSSSSYQHVHVPVSLMQDFLRLARANTEKNLETCGVLAGLLKNRAFHITTLIVPKQESTSDSCQTLNEEEIFEVQDKLSLFPLGWIHTHPSQTCFMSSVDLHTHYSYQVMMEYWFYIIFLLVLVCHCQLDNTFDIVA
uniref:MPN domain-containing protein n=1 Tax=Rhizophora mucronata TaxID=61149 RepID=A0A2P2MGA5_RHIMU